VSSGVQYMSNESEEYVLEVMNLELWPRMQYHMLYSPPRTCGWLGGGGGKREGGYV
jgi:hypothetical protein